MKELMASMELRLHLIQGNSTDIVIQTPAGKSKPELQERYNNIMKRFILIFLFIIFSPALLAQTQIPEGLILYDKPEATVIVVDKAECNMSVFQKQSFWEKIEQYECTTGKTGGDKQQEGDLKTPTGLYFFTDAWTSQDLVRQYGTIAKIYGTGAFELNYPNYLDKVLFRKNGYGIWLHGTDQGVPSATRGCISTTNTDLLKAANYINLHETPLIIEESIAYASPMEIDKVRWELLDFIEKWRVAWESDQSDRYFSFYSGNFKTTQFDYSRWKQYKRWTNKKNQNKRVTIHDISILKAKGIYNIQFVQSYHSSGTNDVGRKRLYVVKEQDQFRIISETWEASESSPSFRQQVHQNHALKEMTVKLKKEMLQNDFSASPLVGKQFGNHRMRICTVDDMSRGDSCSNTVQDCLCLGYHAALNESFFQQTKYFIGPEF